MENPWNIVHEFEKLYNDDKIEELNKFLETQRYDMFFFQDLLYEKLSGSEDKEKIRNFINRSMLGSDLKFDLLIDKFNEDEIEAMLLQNYELLKENLERMFQEKKTNIVRIMKKTIASMGGTIDVKGDNLVREFLTRVNRISPKAPEIKEILDIIGLENVKEFIYSCTDIKLIVRIILFYKDESFLRETLFDTNMNDDVKIGILRELKDKNLFYECLEKAELLKKSFIMDCLEEIGDREASLKFLRDKKFGFRDIEKLEVLFSLNDKELLKQCLYDEELGLNSMSKVIILTQLNDKEYAEKIMKDEKEVFNKQDVIFLKLYFEIGIDEYIQSIKGSQTRLTTGEGSTKGIEIECGLGELDQYIVDITNADEDLDKKLKEGQKWRFGQDGTAIELSSYVMEDNEKAANSIYYVCHLLEEEEERVTESDAAHVHIGTNILTEKQSYINLLEIWLNLEKAMFLVSNKPGELPRKETVTGMAYARQMSQKMNCYLINGEIQITGEESQEEFIAKIREEFGKYSSINLGNIGSEEGSTIEFRTPNGTLDPKIWIENINFFEALMQAAERLAQIQKKPELERTEAEKQKLQLLKNINTKYMDETLKFESLLRIMMTDETQRQIYRQRYIVNSTLLEQNVELKEVLEEDISEFFIGFNPIEIGEHCFEETSAELEGTARSRLHRDKTKEGDKGEKK